MGRMTADKEIKMPDMVLRIIPDFYPVKLPDYHTLERLDQKAKLLATIPIKQ
jgi:hypothetical protein